MADEIALIVGAGQGLSASLARACAKRGMKVALAARNTDKLAALGTETGAKPYACDASQPAAVQTLFKSVEKDLGAPTLVVYNASARVRGPFVEIDPALVARALEVSAYGGFLVAQEAAKRMLGAAPNPLETKGDRVMREIAKDIGREEHMHPTEVAVYFGEPNKKVDAPPQPRPVVNFWYLIQGEGSISSGKTRNQSLFQE